MDFKSLMRRLKALAPLHQAAVRNELPAGRVVFFDPTPGHGTPGIYTDTPAFTALAHWKRAQVAVEGDRDRVSHTALELSVERLEAIAKWVAQQTEQQTK